MKEKFYHFKIIIILMAIARVILSLFQNQTMMKTVVSIHRPPASITFAAIKHALAVTLEPFS